MQLRSLMRSPNLGDLTRQFSQQVPERRRFGRRSTFKRASIIEGGSEQHACIVVDISDDGARLKVSNPTSVLDSFELVIEEDDFIVRCEIVRRESEHVGVRFTSSPRRLSWLRRRSRIKEQVSAIIRNPSE